MSRLKLQFESELAYQLEAIEAACSLFEGSAQRQSAYTVSLPARQDETEETDDSLIMGSKNSTPLDINDIQSNLHAIQQLHGLECSPELQPGALHFTIEMETGTGKTYVYLRTIYELNKRYGFTKFVVVVPSIAIKEGVLKSLEITEEHFRTLYNGVEVNYFLYDRDHLSKVKNFGHSSTLQIMVCTIQSITEIQAEEAEPVNQRVMYSIREQTGDVKPIEFISRCKPIVIIDEPQKLGEMGEENGIACLNPLCTLRYSATHKTAFHPIYSLNAVDAAAQKLVKSIEVASVSNELSQRSAYVRLVRTTQGGKRASIELLHKTNSGNIETKTHQVKKLQYLSDLSNCPDAYDGIFVEQIGANYIKLSHAEEPLLLNQVTGDANDEQIIRAMVRATIKKHLEKERVLRPKGIKVLSLFFIDKVEDYRRYDEDRNPHPGPLADIFEEEYTALAALPDYASLPHPAAKDVHNGYFSIDKGKQGRPDIWTDTEEGSIAKREAAERAYNLILRDKERLLSTEEPLKFIFSHSALKEGWDNPNVFQVCVLRDIKSTITRRQALGRGLRLCVDQSGCRVRDESINTLTVIAGEDFDTYAAALQKEYESEGIRFGLVTAARLSQLTYTDAEGRTATLGTEQAEKLLADLTDRNLVEQDGKPTETLKKRLADGTYTVPDACAPAQNAILDWLKNLFGGVAIKDARRRQSVTSRYQKMRDHREFTELWERINKKTAYRIHFDTEELIELVTKRWQLEWKLHPLTPLILTTTITKVHLQSDRISAGDSTTDTEAVRNGDTPIGDILTTLEEATHLTRATLVRILTQGDKPIIKDIRRNPPQFEKRLRLIIQAAVKELSVANIRYAPLTIGQTEYDAQELFKDTEGYTDKMLKTSEKSIMDHIIWQSDYERRFAEDAEKNEQVKLYIKLPGGFSIPTPVGPYNPDWALVINTGGNNRLYFVVETKSTDTMGANELRPDEKSKIQCALKHFDCIGAGLAQKAEYQAPVTTLTEVLSKAQEQ